jgi:phosphoglycerate kinase
MDRLTLVDLPDAELTGRRVLVRVDYNVPLDAGRVTDDTRIRATIPTLAYLRQRRARLILISHLGRPKGGADPRYSLKPAAERLQKLFDGSVTFVEDTVGDQAAAAVAELQPGDAVVLENVRFNPAEEANDRAFAERLASLADLYVNDAFGSAHRAHASTAAVADVIRRRGGLAVAGLLMERELRFLGAALDAPERPFAAILGGAKISGKIDVIEHLLPRVDHLLIGGAMANTFLRSLGLETGRSLVEQDRIDMAADLLQRAGERMILPVDAVVAPAADASAPARVVDRDAVTREDHILDIGPRTVAMFREFIGRSRTVLWNGPVGMFELAPFAAGTDGVARAVADATAGGAVTIIGGGDTAAAVEAAGLADRFTHVSTGGGASLEFLEGRELPGVASLSPRESS